MESQRQPKQALQERVVQLPGDAFPLCQPFAKPVLKLARDAGNAAADDPPHQSGSTEYDQSEEPPGLVESGLNTYRQVRTRLVPDPIVVTGDYAKPIVSRGQVGVERLAPRAGILPSGIDPLELVAKQHPLGNREAQGGLIDFEPIGVRGQRKIARTRIGLSVGEN